MSNHQRLVHRCDDLVHEAGLSEEVGDPFPVGQRDRSGLGGASELGKSHKWHEGGTRHGDPLVAERALPADEGQPPTRSDGAVKVGEPSDQLGEEHPAEAAEHNIERLGSEGLNLSLAPLGPHAGQASTSDWPGHRSGAIPRVFYRSGVFLYPRSVR